jgi:type IV secretory pathway VirJ component
VKLCTPRDAAPRKGKGSPPGAAKTSAPVEIVAGADDEACRAAGAEGLAVALGARFTKVAGAGHALAAPLDGAIVDAVERVAPPAPTPAAPGPGATAEGGPVPSVAGLPLVEVPSAHPGRRMAILITGDGGWVGADKALAAALADGGISVVGLDSLKYFWKRRTPEETARDVSRILAHYRRVWGRDEVVLVGYSRGADIVPILAERLPPEDRAHLVLVAMLGPSTFAEFEVHAIDLFTSKKRAGAIDTEPSVRATNGYVKMVCFHGEGEKGSLCPKLADLPWVIDRLHGGGHRLGSDEGPELVREILAALPSR